MFEIEHATAWKEYLSTLAVGKTRTINPVDKAWWIKVRHEVDGSYKLSGGWPVFESHDDDFESWACGCFFQYKPHCHEDAGSYDTLDALLADGHPKLMRKSGGVVGFHGKP